MRVSRAAEPVFHIFLPFVEYFLWFTEFTDSLGLQRPPASPCVRGSSACVFPARWFAVALLWVLYEFIPPKRICETALWLFSVLAVP